MDMSYNEVSQVAKMFGHSVAVHQSHYRKHNEIIEKVRIGRLLYMSEAGTVHKQVKI
jgi:hypothetical protein